MEDEMLLSGTECKKERLTTAQKRCVEAYKAKGSVSKAAVLLGLSYSCVSDHLRSACVKLGFTSVKMLMGSDERVADVLTGQLIQLVKKQEFRCALSGELLTPQNSELDHINPRSKGGTDAIENLQWLTKKVNRMKGSMTQKEFIETCRRISEWNR